VLDRTNGRTPHDRRSVHAIHEVLEEVAGIVGLSEKTVKVRRSYARRKLAELLRQPAWNEAAHDGNEQ
jgi:DNA-directed RNA polymerase specialized sigma24 family protein